MHKNKKRNKLFKKIKEKWQEKLMLLLTLKEAEKNDLAYMPKPNQVVIQNLSTTKKIIKDKEDEYQTKNSSIQSVV